MRCYRVVVWQWFQSDDADDDGDDDDDADADGADDA